jgi:undecaprenyl-diphosphatase
VIARLALALLVLASGLQPLDDAVRHDVLSLRRPWLDAPMRIATEQGRPALIGAGVIALAWGAAGRAVLLDAAIVLAPVNLVVEGLKWLVDRARPDGTRRRSNASFPSSHAANAFAVAVLLSRRWPRGAVPFFALAAFVAFSRLYLDRHWLSDVVAGAAIGGLGAWAILRAWNARSRGRDPVPPPTPA